EKARLLHRMEVAITELQAAVDKRSSAVKEHYEKVTEIDRLRVHVKDNILYYMQAIWSHEPPDQRFFRLYNIDVPIVTVHTSGVQVPIMYIGGSVVTAFDLSTVIPMPPKFDVTTKKLVEVADLDNLLGYKGNYMIFALKENNYITLHMMQD